MSSPLNAQHSLHLIAADKKNSPTLSRQFHSTATKCRPNKRANNNNNNNIIREKALAGKRGGIPSL